VIGTVDGNKPTDELFMEATTTLFSEKVPIGLAALPPTRRMGQSTPGAKRWIFSALTFLWCGLAMVEPMGGAPANDRCSGAEPIIPPGALPHFTAITDITLATTNADPPQASCIFDVTSVSRSVWYSFVPAVTAFYSISTCADAPTATTVEDTVMAIYTSAGGCTGPFSEIPTSGSTDGCEDDSCGPQFRQAAITTRLNADTTYYIVVWQFGNAAPPAGKSSIQLRVAMALRPPNDTCATATGLFLNKPVFGTTLLASNDYQLSGSACFTGVGQIPSPVPGRDVVYSFTAPSAGMYSFKVYNYNNAVGYNLAVYVAGACPSGTVPLTVTGCLGAANRNPATSFEEVPCLTLAASQQVFIFVDDAETGNAGSNFSIEVNACYGETEPNNTPTNAVRLACPLTGAISSSSDLDYFALGTFPQGSRVFALVDGNAANSPDFDLRITTMTNTLEYDNRDNAALFGLTSANIAGTPLTGEPAFVQVDGGPSIAIEPYRLYVVVQPPMATATSESEPNNILAQADAANNNYFYGSLAGPAPSTDIDIYSFFAEEDDLIFLSLDGDPLRNNTPLNAKLELLDTDGDILLTVDNDNSLSSTNTPNGLTATFPSSPGEGLTYRALAEAFYHVRVSVSPSASTVAGAGDYLLSIARNCYVGNTGQNTPPSLTSMGVTSPIIENGSATLTVTTTDPDAGEPYQVVVNWGDGSALTTNTVLGPHILNLSRQYLDDGLSDTPTDNYTITAQVADRFGNTAIGNISLAVLNAAPSLSNVVVTSPVSPGQTATLSGLMSDVGTQDTLSLVVNWGDGSAAGTFNYDAGTTSFNVSHVYQIIGTHTIGLTLRDDDTGMTVTNRTITVQSGAAPAQFLSIVKLANGHILLHLRGTPGATYRVQTSANLTAWQFLASQTADSNGFFDVEDTTSPLLPRLFYRAVWP